jgi:hypothetical protein
MKGVVIGIPALTGKNMYQCLKTSGETAPSLWLA